MNKILSCEFNIDTGNVKLRYADGSMISIDCIEVEKEVRLNVEILTVQIILGDKERFAETGSIK